MQISRIPGWLFFFTLFGAFFGPMFFTSRVTHGPAIDVGVALYTVVGAALCLLSSLAIQLIKGGLKWSTSRVIEIVLCCAIVFFLLYNYFEALNTLKREAQFFALKSIASGEA
jgi:protein-S-isoprenylcysteine O-methyltransferase Ste14